MKPTRHQLLAACGLDLDTTDEQVAKILGQWLQYSPYSVHTLRALTDFSEWRIEVRIAKSNNEQSEPAAQVDTKVYIQTSALIPIAPLEYWKFATALAWVLNESHPCSLVPYSGEDNLLVQALNAGIVVDYYNTHVVIDHKSNSLPPGRVIRVAGIPTDFQPQATKEIKVLDKGSVLLGFELAGIPAPKAYDDWRKPDGDSVPTRAEISSEPALGSFTVHYTNGELALVTSGDGKRAKIVHTKHMKSTATKEVSALLGALRPKKESKREQLSEAVVQELAKFFVKGAK